MCDGLLAIRQKQRMRHHRRLAQLIRYVEQEKSLLAARVAKTFAIEGEGPPRAIHISDERLRELQERSRTLESRRANARNLAKAHIREHHLAALDNVDALEERALLFKEKQALQNQFQQLVASDKEQRRHEIRDQARAYHEEQQK
jgi:putative protein kinase ArgK-like GTPase of G3E family